MCIQTTDIRESDGAVLSDNVKGKDTVYTNYELRRHNVPQNAWAAVHGKVLDITNFATRHPGGDIILLAAGKDATVLFETYHPRGVPPELVKKLQVSCAYDVLKRLYLLYRSAFFNFHDSNVFVNGRSVC